MDESTQDSAVEETKLTNWKNAPELTDLKQNYQDGKPIHDLQVGKIQNWLDNLNVEGKAKIKAANGNSQIVPKLIRKQAEWRYPALSEPFLSDDDIFMVKPVTWEDRDAAAQNQLLLNHQFRTSINRTQFFDEYVRAAVDEGTVIVRVGWEYITEMQEKQKPTVEFHPNPAFAEMHQMLAQMKENSPSQYNTDVPDELKEAHELSVQRGVPYEPVITGSETVEEEVVLSNKPTIEVCDFRNVLIDPTCKWDLAKAGFLIYSFESSLSDLEKDGKYKNLDKINVTSNSPLNEPDHKAADNSESFDFKDEPRKKLIVHEYWGYWDIHGDGIVKPIVAAWVGDTLIRLEENPFPDRAIPFVVVQYLPVRNSIYGEPDGALLEDNQKVIGAVTRGMIDLLGKSANGQTGMSKNMLDATNRRKFENGQDYEFNPNMDPRLNVHMHTYPEIPASAQFMLEQQNQEAESLTGVKAYNQGVSGASLGDVAAGVRGALDAASKRELAILRRLSAGVIAIGRKLISMNAEFLSDEEVIRVTNDTFVTIRRDDLPGNFDLKLSISTPEEDNNKAEQLAFMLQTLGPNSDPEIVKMILSDIAKLRKMPDLAKRIEDYEPQPDPLVQREQELKIKLLEAQIQNELAQVVERQANAVLDQAKAGTEEVKQGNIQSDTDKKNLDFVEQESGVTQEREKELHGAQARAQMALKAMDNEYKEKQDIRKMLMEYQKNKTAA